MGADWIDPVLTYGCFVAFNSFSFKKIKCNHGEYEKMFSGDSSGFILDAFQYVVDCWEIFVDRFLEKFLKNMQETEKKEYLENFSKVKCIFACTNMRGYYEKMHFPGDAFFVFGWDERQIGNFKIGEISKKLGDLPQDLETHVAQFLYLFNETDVFEEICEDDTEEESEDSKSDEKTDNNEDRKCDKRCKSNEDSENEKDNESQDSNSDESGDKSQKKSQCTLGHFNSIKYGKAELEKINKYKAKVGKPRFNAGCY